MAFERSNSSHPIPRGVSLQAPQGSPATELPERFFLTETGLYYRDKDDIFVSSPIRVVARTCDRENRNWGRLVEFADSMGVEHSLIVPMNTLSGDAAEVRRILMDAGLMIAAGGKSSSAVPRLFSEV